MEKKFNWIKKGLVFKPNLTNYEWMHSYAQKPTVLILNDRLRVYFACRPKREENGNYTSLTTFVDLDRNNPSKILYKHNQPILSLGNVGTFDQFGIVPGCVLPVANQVRFYYVGWMRAQAVPYTCAIGLAVSEDNGEHFRRIGEGPVLDRTLNEPYFFVSAYVIQEGGLFHMWYSSGIGWIKHKGRMESLYKIMHATSMDGINWERESRFLLPTKTENECQAGPSVIKIGNRFHMWFCYRHGINFRNSSGGYKIGYAWSDDLNDWHRDDDFGSLTCSSKGWDSQMVCYPCVIEVNENIYMFYCGNNFGQEGFGYAQLE